MHTHTTAITFIAKARRSTLQRTMCHPAQCGHDDARGVDFGDFERAPRGAHVLESRIFVRCIVRAFDVWDLKNN